jgi:hypothetical protein
LVHGEADFVYACEWNPHAAAALRFNLQDNQVDDRATVLQGDCRVLARTHNLVNMFDRVSLGLLPSSEGGWWTALQAIRQSTGGWLHIHGNVPVKERHVWTVWLCRRLYEMTKKLPNNSSSHSTWSVICTHVEKVKSFAPTVNHYVADVFVGQAETLSNTLPFCGMVPPGSVVIVDDEKDDVDDGDGNDNGVGHTRTVTTIDLSTPLVVPSCALSKDGVLNQDWMGVEAE